MVKQIVTLVTSHLGVGYHQAAIPILVTTRQGKKKKKVEDVQEALKPGPLMMTMSFNFMKVSIIYLSPSWIYLGDW